MRDCNQQLSTAFQGFRLQDPEVDDIVRTARELEGCTLVPDTSLTAEDNVEMLLRAIRLMQLGLEVHTRDNDGLVDENNGLREDMKV